MKYRFVVPYSNIVQFALIGVGYISFAALTQSNTRLLSTGVNGILCVDYPRAVKRRAKRNAFIRVQMVGVSFPFLRPFCRSLHHHFLALNAYDDTPSVVGGLVAWVHLVAPGACMPLRENNARAESDRVATTLSVAVVCLLLGCRPRPSTIARLDLLRGRRRWIIFIAQNNVYFSRGCPIVTYIVLKWLYSLELLNCTRKTRMRVNNARAREIFIERTVLFSLSLARARVSLAVFNCAARFV